MHVKFKHMLLQVRTRWVSALKKGEDSACGPRKGNGNALKLLVNGTLFALFRDCAVGSLFMRKIKIIKISVV